MAGAESTSISASAIFQIFKKMSKCLQVDVDDLLQKVDSNVENSYHPRLAVQK